MPSLTELDVINTMLRGMGIAPRTSLSRPDRFTASGIDTLRRWNRNVQARGWWFNELKLTVTPGAAPDYSIADQLACNVIEVRGPAGDPVSYRQPGYLYHIRSGEKVTEPINIEVIYELPFAELPDLAQFYVMDCAVLDFTGRLDGGKLEVDKALQTTSLLLLNAENTRQRQTNMFANPSFAEKKLRVSAHRPRGRSW